MRLASQQPLTRVQMEEGAMGTLRGGWGPHLLASAPLLRLISGGSSTGSHPWLREDGTQVDEPVGPLRDKAARCPQTGDPWTSVRVFACGP